MSGLRRVVVVSALLVAGAAAPAERLGVMAVGDPPGGPDPEVSELAHQLRAVCRDRVGGLEEVSAMRARLLGQGSGATVSELDRAYGGALAVYQSGEFESAYRTLEAIISDLEMLPESEEVYSQWVRALLRLAHAALTLGSQKDMDAALLKLARTDLTVLPDPDQYSPSFRRRFEELKGRVRALPRRKLVVAAEGQDGAVFVNGRKMGRTPLTLSLPAGTYRIGGAAGALRVPSFVVDLEGEDRMVVLDFALAGALRVNAGPGLALSGAQRGYGIIRAGAWLGLDRLIVVSRVEEGEAQFLLGSMYDVRRGALLREGSVRMAAGSVPSVNLGALASFLLTGQGSREVKDRTRDGPRTIVAPAVAAEIPLPPTPPVYAVPSTAVLPQAARPGAPAPALAPRDTIASSVPVGATSPPAPAPKPAGTPAAAPIPAATPEPGPFGAPAAAGGSTTAASKTVAATVVRAKAQPAPLERPLPGKRAPTPHGASPAPAPAAPPPAAKPALATLSIPPAAQPPARPLRVPEREPERPRRRHRWMGPVAIGGGILAAGFAGLAVQQGLGSSRSYADANALLGPDGALKPGSDPARYLALRDEARAANRNMYLSAGAAVIFAGAAGVLGWRALHGGPELAPPGVLAFRF
ncbi:PEGA domain-containing protein [Anaeromyxobacter oryzisoli]|uniref:PEGA domain-containing protein n=1 Tax=Anaeromyxobacter oryzisoli TaxID=2925408 RepID=UPI001F5AB8E5|nr:PEGA domain-containing protein [Anaeromyxobacter sp. SG63]